jgi:phosphoglycolate phosphatase
MKILLFDIDGTLVRAGGSGRKALNRAAYRLYGKKEACNELSLAGKTDLQNFHEAIVVATGRKPSRAEIERLHREYLKHLPYFVKKGLREGIYKIPPGIKTLLKRLHKEPGVLLGLGTGNIEQGARIKLGPSGFNDYFRFGGFGSDSYHRAVLLRKAVARARKHMNGDRSRPTVWVIGDTPLDVAAGRKAGYKTIAVGTGFSSMTELVASRPDHLAKDFREVSQWLKWFEIK